MNPVHPQYITDIDGKKISVVLPLDEYEQILEQLDELDDIKLFDKAKAENDSGVIFDDYVKQRRGK